MCVCVCVCVLCIIICLEGKEGGKVYMTLDVSTCVVCEGAEE